MSRKYFPVNKNESMNEALPPLLTDEQIDTIFDAHQDAPTMSFRYLVTRAIEAAARAALEAQVEPVAWSDVLAERRRQVNAEGWTPEHDDEHRTGGMAVAAACYAVWAALPSRPASETVATLWPWTGWTQSWFKPRDARRNLVKAGALILAEIERLDRRRCARAAEASKINQGEQE